MLYEGDPKKFDYSSLTQHEGVAFIGARKESDTPDFVQAIKNLGGDNVVYVKALRKEDNFGHNFENSTSIKERSPQYHLFKFNRIGLHYARMKDRGNQVIMGAGHTKYQPLHEALAFLLHGAGHNAEKDSVKIFGKQKGEGSCHAPVWVQPFKSRERLCATFEFVRSFISECRVWSPMNRDCKLSKL